MVVEPEVGEQPGQLDEDLGALAVEELGVARGGHVAVDRVGDIGVDVVLRGARRVVRRGLFAVDRPPREQRSALAHLDRPLARQWKGAVTEVEQLAGGVDKSVASIACLRGLVYASSGTM